MSLCHIIYILILLKRQQLAVIQARDSTEVSQEFLNAAGGGAEHRKILTSPFGRRPRTGCSTSMLASTFPMVLSVSLRLTYNVTRTIIAMRDYASRKNDNRESVHVRLSAYKSAPPREHEHQSIFDLRALRGFLLSTASRHEVLRE